MITLPQADESNGSLLPDLTPLLDVIFIVMVFLMLTANVAPQVLEVELPQESSAHTETLTDPKTIAVNLLPGDDGWAIDSKKYSSWDSFSSALKTKVTENKDHTLMIAGDRQVPMERLVKLMVFLQNNKITAAQIQMEESQ